FAVATDRIGPAPTPGLIVSLPSAPSVGKVPTATPRGAAVPAASPRQGGSALVPTVHSQAQAPSANLAQSPAGAASTADSGPGVIRPMTLVPVEPPQSVAATFSLMDDPSGGGNEWEPPDPSVTLSGGGVMSDEEGNYYGIVGGQVAIVVSTPIDENIQSVTYKVSGAVESQSWTVSAGHSTRLAGAVTHTAPPGEALGTVDWFSFCWDETTGNHTISVQVNYARGAAPAKNLTVAVEKPDADMSMVTKPLKFGQHALQGGNYIGFYQDDPGVYFKASATTHRFGGDFAFLQTISIDLKQTYFATGQITETSPTVLDWNGQNPGNPLAIMVQDSSYTMYPAETQNIPFSRPPLVSPPAYAIHDTPVLSFGSYSNPLNRPTRFYQDVVFTTRLVYNPGGIWISLGYLIWNLHGERSFLNQAGFNYEDPNNWGGTQSLTPPSETAGTKQMVPELLPEWSENSQKYLKEWDQKKP
ncbi:hypothetical protein, partial [Singulisphaera acidiphila]